MTGELVCNNCAKVLAVIEIKEGFSISGARCMTCLGPAVILTPNANSLVLMPTTKSPEKPTENPYSIEPISCSLDDDASC